MHDGVVISVVDEDEIVLVPKDQLHGLGVDGGKTARALFKVEIIHFAL